jgi:hypothetical protein
LNFVNILSLNFAKQLIPKYKDMKYLRLILVCISFAICTLNAFAQLASEVRLASVNLRYENDKVREPYQLINGKTSDRYVDWVEFFNEKNQQLTVNSTLFPGAGDYQPYWINPNYALRMRNRLKNCNSVA